MTITALMFVRPFIQLSMNSSMCPITTGTQLSPEIFDPRKTDSKCLEANSEYFRFSTARDDKNDKNCQSYFLVFGQKSC